MKKQLIIAGIAAAMMLSTSMTFANTATDNTTPKKPTCNCKCNKQKPPKMARPSLDEQLQLTEEQKAKAHEIRMKGHEQIKPVIEKMKAKHQEIKEVAKSTLSQDKKDKKIAELKKEMKALKQEARKIRTENTKEFEAILTPEQKAKFEKIKKDARAKHKAMMKKGKRPNKEFGPQAQNAQPTPQK